MPKPKLKPNPEPINRIARCWSCNHLFENLDSEGGHPKLLPPITWSPHRICKDCNSATTLKSDLKIAGGKDGINRSSHQRFPSVYSKLDAEFTRWENLQIRTDRVFKRHPYSVRISFNSGFSSTARLTKSERKNLRKLAGLKQSDTI